jgi:hypothetical protein
MSNFLPVLHNFIAVCSVQEAYFVGLVLRDAQKVKNKQAGINK